MEKNIENFVIWYAPMVYVLKLHYHIGLLRNSLQFDRPRGRFKNTYKLLNPRALKNSMLYQIRIFQCMGKIFYVEFPFEIPHKYHTHTLRDVHFIHR